MSRASTSVNGAKVAPLHLGPSTSPLELTSPAGTFQTCSWDSHRLAGASLAADAGESGWGKGKVGYRVRAVDGEISAAHHRYQVNLRRS